MHHKLGTTIGTALALLTTLTACSQSAPGSLEPDSEPAMPIATYAPTGTGGDMALLRGALDITSTCTYLNDGTERIVLVFPQDEVTFDPASRELIYHGARFASGAEIELTGGLSPDVSFIEGDICDAHSPIWVVAQSD